MKQANCYFSILFELIVHTQKKLGEPDQWDASRCRRYKGTKEMQGDIIRKPMRCTKDNKKAWHGVRYWGTRIFADLVEHVTLNGRGQCDEYRIQINIMCASFQYLSDLNPPPNSLVHEKWLFVTTVPTTNGKLQK